MQSIQPTQGWVGQDIMDSVLRKCTQCNLEGSFTINKYLLTYVVEGNVFAKDSIAYGDKVNPHNRMK